MNLKAIQKIEKEGDKCLKTGLFNWSKDFTGAAGFYDTAVDEYKAIEQFEYAIDVYWKLTMVNENMNDSWAIARNLEGISECYRHMGVNSVPQYLELINKSFRLFMLSDGSHNFIEMVNRIGEHLEQSDDSEGRKKIMMAAYSKFGNSDIGTDRYNFAFKIIDLCVQDNDYLSAIKVASKEYTFMKVKAPGSVKLKTFAVDIVLLALLINDHVLAETRLNTFGEEIQGFFSCRECEFCDTLINAYKEKDQARWDKQINAVIAGVVFPSIIVARARKIYLGVPESKGKKEGGEKAEEDNPFF